MIRVRFDNMADEDRLIGYAMLPQVPATGEVINIDGHPWVVQSRGWATRTAKRAPTGPSEMFAYLGCVPFKPLPQVNPVAAAAGAPQPAIKAWLRHQRTEHAGKIAALFTGMSWDVSPRCPHPVRDYPQRRHK